MLGTTTKLSVHACGRGPGLGLAVLSSGVVVTLEEIFLGLGVTVTYHKSTKTRLKKH